MKEKLEYNIITNKAIRFFTLKTTNGLAKLLVYSPPEFTSIIKNASYREFKILKSKGGTRTIESPSEELRVLQKRLNLYLQSLYCMIKPKVAYGFVLSYQKEKRPHTILSNAQNHLNKKYVLNMDLKDFFHSISTVQVKEFFMHSPFKFSEDLATCLALICCYQGRLPMGAPTSPVISNLICIPLDKLIVAIAKEHKLMYSRYADDITFSTDETISEVAIAQIKASITNFGFSLNEKKFRIQSKFRKQSVTGIVVNAKPNVDRKYVRNIRAAIHNIRVHGLEAATQKHYSLGVVDKHQMRKLKQTVEGKINFIGQVKGKDDEVYKGLYQKGQEVGMFKSVIRKVII